MAKILKQENHRIEVTPDMWPYDKDDPKWAKIRMSALCDSIKRHCDVGSVGVHWDTSEVCSYCGHLWSSALDDDGVPVCCDAAVAEHQRSTSNPSPDK